MCPVLFHIYGPFSINAYGVAIVAGLILFLYFALKDPRRIKLMPEDKAMNLFSINILLALIGGRILHVISGLAHYESAYRILAVWDGGFSLLGALIAIIIFNPLYLLWNKIPVLPALDVIGTYVPLVQAFGRIGCLFAGCCYGLGTNLPWGITYQNQLSIAPLGISLHPTQLYGAALHITAFFIFKYLSTKPTRPGVIFAFYLIFASSIRFFIDFLRDDRTDFTYLQSISLEQALALALFLVALILLGALYATPEKKTQSKKL